MTLSSPPSRSLAGEGGPKLVALTRFPRRLRRPITKPTGASPQDALALAKLGFRIHPVWGLRSTVDPIMCGCPRSENCCDGPGKHPIGSWRRKATTDLAKVQGFWREHGACNYGVSTGAFIFDGVRRYLVVIDVDSEEALSWLHQLVELPATFIVWTGRGVHLYFVSDVPYTNATRKLKAAGVEDIDIRCEGGYVLGPGSLHGSGRRYRALGNPTDIAPLPPALAEFLEEAPTTARREARSKRRRTKSGTARRSDLSPLTAQIRRALKSDPPKGQRSEAAFAAIRLLIEHGCDDDEIYDLVIDEPVGKRYREGHDLIADIPRIRAKVDVTPEERQEGLERFLENHWRAAEAAALRATTLKVLRALHEKIRDCGFAGTLAMAQAHWAICAGVDKKTLKKHVQKLIEAGLVICVHKAEAGDTFASTYGLSTPSGHLSPSVSQGLNRGGDMSLQNLAPTSGAKKRPQIDVSSDSARYTVSSTLWNTVGHLSEDVRTTAKALAERIHVHPRTARNHLKDLDDLNIVFRSPHGAILKPGWFDEWNRLSVGTKQEGRHEREKLRLAEERAARSEVMEMRRKRWRAAQRSERPTVVATEAGQVDPDTGEIMSAGQNRQNPGDGRTPPASGRRRLVRSSQRIRSVARTGVKNEDNPSPSKRTPVAACMDSSVSRSSVSVRTITPPSQKLRK